MKVRPPVRVHEFQAVNEPHIVGVVQHQIPAGLYLGHCMFDTGMPSPSIHEDKVEAAIGMHIDVGNVGFEIDPRILFFTRIRDERPPARINAVVCGSICKEALYWLTADF